MHLYFSDFSTAERIAEQIRSLTKDYRVGFGSFSDKPIAPFSAEVSSYLGRGYNTYNVPYSFEHKVFL